MSDDIKGSMDDGMITDDDKLWGALSLAIPIVGLIALLMEEKKNRAFIRHAAVNGLAVSVATFVVTFVLGFIPLINCIGGLLGLGVFAYMIYLAVTETYNGEYVEIPFVSDFVRGQGWV
ncbi:MAG: putative membrane protein [Candidatus Promineifilaceae bacterium]|jgi:uncharacterized membrane protein